MADSPNSPWGPQDPYARRQPAEPGREAGTQPPANPGAWTTPSSWTTPSTYDRDPGRVPDAGGPASPPPAGRPPADQYGQPPADRHGPPPADRQREGRGRPGWGALVGATAAAALLASGLTAGVTGAWDDDSQPAALTSGSETTEEQEAGDPVVDSTSQNPDWEAVADAVQLSVAAITVSGQGGGGVGSGVVIDEEGHILTNEHVVAPGASGQIVVTLADGSMHEATIVGTDVATDLAVIALDDPPEDLTPATFGDSEQVEVGHAVAAVGNPLGLSSTLTTGVVSALDRPVTTVRQSGQLEQPTQVTTNAIQVDAPINPGNSGGPLFDSTGRVIGITSSIATLSGSGEASGSIGLGFAIPVNLAQSVAQQLIEDGTVEHAFLGVGLADATATAGGTTRSGAAVRQVEGGGPADEAGLQEGDVIIAVEGEPVVSASSLVGWVRQHSSGETIDITYVRDGEEAQTEATLTTRPDDLAG